MVSARASVAGRLLSMREHDEELDHPPEAAQALRLLDQASRKQHCCL